MVDAAKERTDQQKEVDRNYAIFRRLLPALLETDADRFALMRNGAIVACFDTSREAIEAGRERFGGAPFSVQEITDRTVDLGHLSHAGILGRV